MAEMDLVRNPFDQIRNEDNTGEWWSGRELQPVMNYSQWRDFALVIEKAKAALALVSGQAMADQTFQQVTRVVHVRNLGDQQRVDYRLTRFGAYLTAMAGDDTKRAVAEARIYFAVKARHAEVAIPRQREPELDELEVARRYVKAIEDKRAAIARAEKAEGFKRAIEAGDGLQLRSFHKKYFSTTPERVFFDHLYAKGFLINQRGKGPANPRTGEPRDGRQHRHPTFKGKEWFYLHSEVDRYGQRQENTRVRPGDPELALRDKLASQGLVPNEEPAALFELEVVA